MKRADYLKELEEIKIDLLAAVKNIEKDNLDLAQKYIQQAQNFTKRLQDVATIEDDEN